MTVPRLTIRSARALSLAREIARAEGRTMGKVVEEALEEYARSVEMRPKSETPDAFYDRLLRDYATDLDLEEVIAPLRTPHEAPKMNYPRALTWAPEGP